MFGKNGTVHKQMQKLKKDHERLWDFLKLKHNAVKLSCEIKDPIKSGVKLTEPDQINQALSDHFDSIRSIQNKSKTELANDVEFLMYKIESNLIQADTPIMFSNEFRKFLIESKQKS